MSPRCERWSPLLPPPNRRGRAQSLYRSRPRAPAQSATDEAFRAAANKDTLTLAALRTAGVAHRFHECALAVGATAGQGRHSARAGRLVTVDAITSLPRLLAAD